LKPAVEAKGIKFEITLESASCLVRGDANRLQQIFWNLFSNAIKFTPQDGGVRVGVKVVDERVRVSVNDSGIGITPEFLPYIFDRFRQADGSTTRVHGGLGLGLSIVKHLVQLHDGGVEVDSQGKDQGASFTVSLRSQRTYRVTASRMRLPQSRKVTGCRRAFPKYSKGGAFWWSMTKRTRVI
jgi:signal transduction histidine kinase